MTDDREIRRLFEAGMLFTVLAGIALLIYTFIR